VTADQGNGEEEAVVDALERIREYLGAKPAGPVGDLDALVSLLKPAWPALEGGDAEGMYDRKLAKLEKPQWGPPLLTFRIERHGAIVVGGSTRAEMQTWTIDVDRAEVGVKVIGHRQIEPMAKPLDVRPIAAEIARLLRVGADDERLTWYADRARVRVVVSRVIPEVDPKQTVAGRRKRFRSALREAMISSGWTEVSGTSPNTYERKSGTGRGGSPDPGERKRDG
jgi:hypothetical protein